MYPAKQTKKTYVSYYTIDPEKQSNSAGMVSVIGLLCCKSCSFHSLPHPVVTPSCSASSLMWITRSTVTDTHLEFKTKNIEYPGTSR